MKVVVELEVSVTPDRCDLYVLKTLLEQSLKKLEVVKVLELHIPDDQE